MAAAKMTTHATEQSSVTSHSSLAATEHERIPNVGGDVDANASMPITTQLLSNLLQSNSRSMRGQTMADAEMTIEATEQHTVATHSSLIDTEHATSHSAAEQSVAAEDVIWQVKFKSWLDLPQEASADIEAAYKEGRTDSGIYHQRRSETRVDPYCIDFNTMQQTNMGSGRERDARRDVYE